MKLTGLLTIICLLAVASPTRATPIAIGDTEDGGTVVSTVVGSDDRQNLVDLLMAQNNDATTAGQSPFDLPGLTDAFQGTDVEAMGTPLGHLLPGPDGFVLTYDRLARKRVLQLFGYHGHALLDTATDQPVTHGAGFNAAGVPASGGVQTTGGVAPRQTSGPPPVPPLYPYQVPAVPEPTTAALMLTLSLTLLMRQRTERA